MTRTDRLNPARTDQDVRQILLLVVEVRESWAEAVDGGVYAPRVESNGRGKGFTDLKPTESAAASPTQRQLRSAAKRAAVLIAESRLKLEDAARVLHNGFARTDPEVLAEYLEKHNAATQPRRA